MMNPYDNVPQTTGRRRRTERYAESYVTEQPATPAASPEVTDNNYRAPAAGTPVSSAKNTAPYPPVQAEVPSVTGNQQLYYPQQSGYGAYQQSYGAAQPAWQQPYGGQNQGAGWQQGWQVQENATPQSPWQQPYSAPLQQSWSQPSYAAPQQNWQNGYQPPVEDGMQPMAEPPRKPARPKWPMLLVLAIVGVAVLLGGGFGVKAAVDGMRIRDSVVAYDNRFCEGVYVDGIHLGGMTQEEAWNAVSANAQMRRDSWEVRLTYQGGLVYRFTADDVGMTIDVNEALEQAWAQGHSSSDIGERRAAMDALLVEPYYGYTALPSGNTAAVDAILSDIANQVYRAPQDAYIEEFNPELTYPFVIKDEVYGRRLNVEPVRTQLYQKMDNMEGGSIEIVPDVIMPNVTAADLRATVQLRGSASTQVSTTSTENRNKNLKRAMELINGTVLKPGESFSFNGIVGQRSAANGFFPAIEYAYGEEREGYGGGVCQVSTTVYLAAVKSNLQITKREQHSDKVNYTEYGLDATVNLDGKKIDLTFKNNTEGNIYIVARWLYDPHLDKDHSYCVVEVYGPTLGDGVTYDLVAVQVEELLPPEDPEYIEDKTGTKVVYIDDEPVLKRKATKGCVVESYRVMYVNGTEYSREFMYRDTYKAKSAQYYVGVSDRPLGE